MNLFAGVHPEKFPVTEIASNIQELVLITLDFSRKSKYITVTIVPLVTLSGTDCGGRPQLSLPIQVMALHSHHIHRISEIVSAMFWVLAHSSFTSTNMLGGIT